MQGLYTYCRTYHHVNLTVPVCILYPKDGLVPFLHMYMNRKLRSWTQLARLAKTLDRVTQRTMPEPNILITGTPGCGKSTLAVSAVLQPSRSGTMA
jgi:predicted GTPase